MTKEGLRIPILEKPDMAYDKFSQVVRSSLVDILLTEHIRQANELVYHQDKPLAEDTRKTIMETRNLARLSMFWGWQDLVDAQSPLAAQAREAMQIAIDYGNGTLDKETLKNAIAGETVWQETKQFMVEKLVTDFP